MRKLFCILFTICYLPFYVNAQQIDWERSYGWENYNNESVSSILFLENNIYSFGTTSFDSGAVVVLRLNSFGDTTKLDFINNYKGWGSDLDMNFQSELLFLGQEIDGDMCVFKTDTNSNVFWYKQYENSFYNETNIFSLNDGGAIVFGSNYNIGIDFFTSRIDANGNEIWNNNYIKGGYEFCNHATTLNDGSLLISGYRHVGLNRNIFYLKIDSDGNEIASDTITTGVNDGFYTKGLITPCRNGDYIISAYNSDDENSSVFRMDSNFNYIWHYSKNNYRFLEPHEMQDGSIIVAGQSASPRYGTVIKLASNGTLIKEEQATNPNFNVSEFFDIAFDGEGNAVAAGKIDYFGTPARDEFYYVKYNDIGVPVPLNYNCNPPEILGTSNSISSIGGTDWINVGVQASENLEYSDIIGYTWFFQDGYTEFNQYVTYDFDETIYPDSFWCMAVVTDGIGCTDTITIDAYTGNVIYPNPTWNPNPTGIKEKFSNSIQKPTIYPNPFNETLTVKLSSLRGKYDRSNLFIKIYNILGEEVMNHLIASPKVRNDEIVLDVSKLQKGVYIIEIKTDNYIYSERIIKD